MGDEKITRVEITNAAIQYPVWWKPWVEVRYIDVPNLLSFDILERNSLRPWGIRILENRERPYICVICKINKKKSANFCKSMNELRKLILMCGHNDYDDFCSKFINDDIADSVEVKACDES